MRQQNNKACPGVAAPKQAEETAAFRGALHFCTHFNSEPPPRQSWQFAENSIAELLQCGEENAIPARELIETSACRSRRELYRQIKRERDSGALILASAKGFFLPSQDPVQARQEIEAWTSAMTAKSVSIQATLKTARESLRQCDGQEILV